MKFIFLVCLFLFQNCYTENLISINDINLKEKSGVLFYKDKEFSGELVSFFSEGKIEFISNYKNGLKDGEEKIWFINGNLLSKRSYFKGKKIGNHIGFHENGDIRYFFQFEDDKQIGENFTWYPNSKIETYNKFLNGKQLVYKHWRIDGTIFSNYVWRNEERIGLYGAKLCRRVDEVKN